MNARPWGPDGGLLCNCEATKFKLNLQGITVFTRLEICLFTYGIPDTGDASCGFLLVVMRFINEKCGCRNNNHGVAFECVAWFWIFQSGEE